MVLTPEGFPLAYEIMPGNTSDQTTLHAFRQKIEAQYGKASRVRVMDRGIPTEDTLERVRRSDPPIGYLVGTPRARWAEFRADFEKLPWQKLHATVEVKLLAHGEEVYVLAKSAGACSIRSSSRSHACACCRLAARSRRCRYRTASRRINARSLSRLGGFTRYAVTRC